MSPTILRLGTRRSGLALWQAQTVKTRLESVFPERPVEIVPILTRGDTAQGSLTEQGGKGLFIKEIETALADGRVDIAVHSVKDMPCPLDSRFALAAVLARDDPRDAWIDRDGRLPETAPGGTRVGTGSPRRASALRRHWPHLVPVPLRGNVDTRLGRIGRGGVDAVVLSCSGLDRLGWSHRIHWRIDPSRMVPAIGQGAIALEVRAEDAAAAAQAAAIGDPRSLAEVRAERRLLEHLGGDCHSAIGVWIHLTDPAPGSGAPSLALGQAFVADPDSSSWAEAKIGVPGGTGVLEALVQSMHRQLIASGAERILELRHRR